MYTYNTVNMVYMSYQYKLFCILLANALEYNIQNIFLHALFIFWTGPN